MERSQGYEHFGECNSSIEKGKRRRFNKKEAQDRKDHLHSYLYWLIEIRWYSSKENEELIDNINVHNIKKMNFQINYKK